GLVGGLVGEEIDTKVNDNQGIHQSIKNSLIFGIIFMVIGILISAALHYFHEPMQLSEILVLGTGIGFVLGASNGGLLSAIKHCALRITLWLFGYAPWNYSKFLRYCTDRGFLQRVGGGYRFVHALLRDHFADHYDPS
ncbi:MAG: NACHT domain-containing protein, partial [Phormidium sp. BM_Day4_Bin.17]|nr:NACHT domain-containing protein [Phormidium sp. BM_Day4_Bin.17]